MAKRTVRPSAANARMSVQNDRRVSTSIPTVGSSRKTRSGSPAIAIAKRRRWASPPESVSTGRPLELAQARPVEDRRGRKRLRIEAPDERDELADPGGDRQAGRLEQGADPAGGDGARGAEPEGADGPARRVQEAEHQADRRRLAGAIRAEEGHGLPDRDVDADAVEGDRVAVALRHVFEGDGGRTVGSEHGGPRGSR